jgi:hypothetical protein
MGATVNSWAELGVANGDDVAIGQRARGGDSFAIQVRTIVASQIVEPPCLFILFTDHGMAAGDSHIREPDGRVVMTAKNGGVGYGMRHPPRQLNYTGTHGVGRLYKAGSMLLGSGKWAGDDDNCPPSAVGCRGGRDGPGRERPISSADADAGVL